MPRRRFRCRLGNGGGGVLRVIDGRIALRRDTERSGCCDSGNPPKPSACKTDLLSPHAHAFHFQLEVSVADEIRVHQQGASKARNFAPSVTKKPHLTLKAGLKQPSWSDPSGRGGRCLHWGSSSGPAD